MNSSQRKRPLYQTWFEVAFTYHPLPGGIKPKPKPRDIVAFNTTMRWIRDKYPSLTDADFILAMHYMFIHNPLFLDNTHGYLNLQATFCKVLSYYVRWKKANNINAEQVNTWRDELLREKPEYEVFLMSLINE